MASESRLRRRMEQWKIVRDVIAGFNALLRSRTLIWQLLLCMTASNAVRLFTIMLCFQAAGHPVNAVRGAFVRKRRVAGLGDRRRAR